LLYVPPSSLLLLIDHDYQYTKVKT
jgi:hypothetical protein